MSLRNALPPKPREQRRAIEETCRHEYYRRRGEVVSVGTCDGCNHAHGLWDAYSYTRHEWVPFSITRAEMKRMKLITRAEAERIVLSWGWDLSLGYF